MTLPRLAAPGGSAEVWRGAVLQEVTHTHALGRVHGQSCQLGGVYETERRRLLADPHLSADNAGGIAPAAWKGPVSRIGAALHQHAPMPIENYGRCGNYE
jgi:hypothetical protein